MKRRHAVFLLVGVLGLLVSFGKTVRSETCVHNLDCIDGCCLPQIYSVSGVFHTEDGPKANPRFLCSRYSPPGAVCQPYSVSACGCRPGLTCRKSSHPLLREHNVMFCLREEKMQKLSQKMQKKINKEAKKNAKKQQKTRPKNNKKEPRKNMKKLKKPTEQ